MLDAVVFDLDDTLYEYGELNRRAIQVLCEFTCQKLLISSEEFMEAFIWARKETKKTLENTGASHNRMLYCQKILEYLNKFSAELGLAMYDTYWNYFLSHMVLREGAKEVLEICHRQKIKVGICSDLTAHIQHRKIKKLGISVYINAIVTSEEAGAEKPAPIMFKMILDKLRAEPSKTIFIGDSWEKDIKGAEQMGMKTIWLSSKKRTGYRSITSFEEVRKIIYEYQQN